MKIRIPFFLVIGGIMLLIANISSIGYVLYLWSGTGMAFELTVWTAFKFWIYWMLWLFFSLFFSYLGYYHRKNPKYE
jgi:membrane protein implicated in regulation of membrane protease activity